MVSSLDQALDSIVRLLGRSLDTHDVATAIAEAAAQLPNVAAAALLRLESADTLIVEAGAGLGSVGGRFPGVQLAAGRALATEQLFEVADVAAESTVTTPPSQEGAPFAAILAAPLLDAAEPVRWALSVYGRTPGAFPERTHELLRLLAGAAGAALRNAAAFEHEARERREAQAINEAALAMTSELSVDRLLELIVSQVRDLVGARYAALGVPGPNGKLARFITVGISPMQRSRIGPLPEGHGLLGALLHDNAVVRLPRLADDPRSYGFPPHHPPMTSFLGVPILYRGRNLGDLYLTDKLDAPEFSEEDEQIVIRLAAHAAVAIVNAQTYGATNEQLEHKVAELAEKNGELQRLSSGILAAQEDERRRIARELHDDTMQALAALTVQARLIEKRDDVQELRNGVASMREGIGATLAELRRLAYDLRPTALDDLGLTAALEGLAHEFVDAYGVRVQTRLDYPETRLPAAIEVTLYRIAQEALSNVRHHAAASEAALELRVASDTVSLAISDNGRGIPSERRLASREGGLGLLGMEERAQAQGGRMTIESAQGRGTVVRVELPRRKPL
jgi:signal transduction histidine kinase